MNETNESSKEPANPPFQIGELVKMRAKALQLVRFFNLPKDDIGIVTGYSKSKRDPNVWLIDVHWQKHIPKGGKILSYRAERLKRVFRKKKVDNEQQ